MDGKDRCKFLTDHLPTSDPVSLASDYLTLSNYSRIKGDSGTSIEIPLDEVIAKTVKALLLSSESMTVSTRADHMRLLLIVLHIVKAESASALFNNVFTDDESIMAYVKDGFGDGLIYSLDELMSYYPRDKIDILTNFIDNSHHDLLSKYKP